MADEAINSKNNLNLIKAAGYDYIVNIRLKHNSKQIKNEIFYSLDIHHLTIDQAGNMMFNKSIRLQTFRQLL